MNYHNLNDQTVKNNYPLPLITDLIDNMGSKQVFTKIDLLQMATYWFVIAWFDNQSIQKSKVRQAAKDVVKSKVYPQTYSS